jgi:hypothetical protein
MVSIFKRSALIGELRTFHTMLWNRMSHAFKSYKQ